MESELKSINEIKNLYTVIPNALLNDKTLSAQAKCLYALLASKPSGWTFCDEELAEEMNCFTYSLWDYLEELKQARWVEITPTMVPRGKRKKFTILLKQKEE